MMLRSYQVTMLRSYQFTILSSYNVEVLLGYDVKVLWGLVQVPSVFPENYRQVDLSLPVAAGRSVVLGWYFTSQTETTLTPNVISSDETVMFT